MSSAWVFLKQNWFSVQLQGKEYLFVANADNLGATVDLSIQLPLSMISCPLCSFSLIKIYDRIWIGCAKRWLLSNLCKKTEENEKTNKNNSKIIDAHDRV